MIITRFILIPLIVLTRIVHADPQVIKAGGTSYLKDAESYVDQAPVIAKLSPMPKPSPTQASSPPAVIHRSSMNVGRQIPVPTQYLPPQVIQGGNSGVTVVPSTPTAFQTIQTGTTMGSDGSGNTTFRDTEVSGVVNYGSPIRTVVPVSNQEGRPIGSQTITITPNPIIVPVTTTIEITH